MSNTATDLARDVLRKIGVLDAQSDPSNEDSQNLQNLSRFKHAELSKSHVCYWDYDDIPDEVYLPLRDYFALVFGGDYGYPATDAQIELALYRLETAAKPRYVGTKLKSDYPITAGAGRGDFTTGT